MIVAESLGSLCSATTTLMQVVEPFQSHLIGSCKSKLSRAKQKRLTTSRLRFYESVLLMSPNNLFSDDKDNEVSAPRQKRRFELFFFESVNGRTYLRFTRLAVALIIALTVIPLAALLILFLSRPAVDDTKVDVTIRPRPDSTSTNGPIIKQPPPQRLPPTLRHQPMPPAPSPPVLESRSRAEVDRQKQTADSPAPPRRP